MREKWKHIQMILHIDGLVQDCRNSSALAVLHLNCYSNLLGANELNGRKQ